MSTRNRAPRRGELEMGNHPEGDEHHQADHPDQPPDHAGEPEGEREAAAEHHDDQAGGPEDLPDTEADLDAAGARELFPPGRHRGRDPRSVWIEPVVDHRPAHVEHEPDSGGQTHEHRHRPEDSAPPHAVGRGVRKTAEHGDQPEDDEGRPDPPVLQEGRQGTTGPTAPPQASDASVPSMRASCYTAYRHVRRTPAGHNVPRGGSSVGQSKGLIIPGSWVRAPPAPPGLTRVTRVRGAGLAPERCHPWTVGVEVDQDFEGCTSARRTSISMAARRSRSERVRSWSLR